MQHALALGKHLHLPLGVDESEFVMRRIRCGLFRAPREFLWFLIAFSTIGFSTDFEVGIYEEDVVNVHLIRRVYTDNVTMPNKEPLCFVPVFDQVWRPASS